jgi:hypothetical protein
MVSVELTFSQLILNFVLRLLFELREIHFVFAIDILLLAIFYHIHQLLIST